MRDKLVNIAKEFLNAKQGDAKHRRIVDIYNSILPHPRGYVLQLTDPWCAAFVSAIAVLCDLTDYIPVECSCGEQIKRWQDMGRWEENDAYTPKRGDIIYFDWQDGPGYANNDNEGAPDHVGIVVWVARDDILVIDGNKGEAHTVGYRELNVNGRYIRGYGLPDYEAAEREKDNIKTCTPQLPILQYRCKGAAVKALQTLLNLRGASLDVDGSFGPKTRAAVYDYQLDRELTVDGSVGPETWAHLVGKE